MSGAMLPAQHAASVHASTVAVSAVDPAAVDAATTAAASAPTPAGRVRLGGVGSPLQVVAVLLLVAAAIAAALTLNGYYVFVLANVALLAITGIGLNVLLGLTGQVSLGHVGFFAIGAYTVAILTTRFALSFWLAWPLAALLAGLTGALLSLPALRVKGPYLAMVTIAFGFVIENAIVEAGDFTGGQNGIMGVTAPDLGTASIGGLLQGERLMAVVAWLTVTVALMGYAWLARGTWGAAMRAVRDSEVAAQSIGLDPLAIKTMAFAVSALLAGVAGGLFAPLSGFVTPHTFNFSQSILYVLVVMIGGAGSVLGPLVGALVVGLLPELLSGLEAWRLLFFGALLLVVLWVAPNGIVGLVRTAQGWLRPKLQPQALARAHPPTAAPVVADAASSAATGTPAPALSSRRRRGLSARGLSMQFGGLRAVSELDFDAAPGRITSLIGPNGAGKTTALNMLSGFYVPSAGRFGLAGGMAGSRGAEPAAATDLAGASAMRIARAGIARSYQTSQLFAGLRVQDNVALALSGGRLGPLLGADRLSGAAARLQAQRLLAWCGCEHVAERPASELAHVDRRLVAIARALATDPDVLLLDEPAAGLSREDKASLALLLRRIADAGVAVVLVEHDMALVMGISDHVVVLDAGQRLAAGTPAAVQADPAVRRAYLGDAAAEGDVAGLGSAAAASRSAQAVGQADAHTATAAAPRTVPGKASQSAHHTAPHTAPRTAPRTIGAELLGVGNLQAGYGAGPVLHGISLQVREGEVVALLGANGAGKSTLMHALAGLHRPVRGGIHMAGVELVNLGAEQVVAQGLVLVPEGRQVFAELSVRDNILLGAFLHPADADARLQRQLQRFPRLRERLHQRAGLLSGGEQQMLAIARALMSKPRLLLLDEPSLGLAPKVIAELFEALDGLRREGMTLLLVDQMAALALALADRAYVIEGGRIVAEGPAAQIAADPALAQAYLGESAAHHD